MNKFYNDNINKELPWLVIAWATVTNNRRITILITGS